MFKLINARLNWIALYVFNCHLLRYDFDLLRPRMIPVRIPDSTISIRIFGHSITGQSAVVPPDSCLSVVPFSIPSDFVYSEQPTVVLSSIPVSGKGSTAPAPRPQSAHCPPTASLGFLSSESWSSLKYFRSNVSINTQHRITEWEKWL